jgi:hypothetical protein
MTHTHSQDLEAHFTSLHSNLTDTQQEVQKISANISTINQKMHSSIVASISELKDDLKQDIITQLESITMMICAKMHIHIDLPVSDPPFHTEGETSYHSQNFQPYHFQHDLCLLHMDVTKFDVSDPTGWVIQMEHYFSLYGITDDFVKLRYCVLHLDQEHWKWWKWRKNALQGYVAWTHFLEEIYECFDTDTNHLGHLTKLKQYGTMEEFIVSFERLDFRREGMYDDFFPRMFYQ